MSEPLRFQHYEVARKPDGSPLELGRGAMGITYRAFDTNLRADVALKVISGAYLNSDVARDRFLREARAAAAIRHPNVATVFHLGEAEDSYFYAMEFVDGETVEKFMRREGALATVEALEIASQVARALQAAQKQGLVHRDIKPSNIMLTRDEDDDIHVKVIDFGLAKAAATGGGDGADAPTLTMGGFLGTPHFASPEQLDERELDVRSDIYSLGVTLFYMLAGEVPFGGSLAQTISRQLQHDPPWEKIESQPGEVRELLVRMMAKDPADRIADPLELRRAIDQCQETVSQKHLGTPGGDPAAPLTDTDTASHALTESPEPRVGHQLADRFDLIEELPANFLGRRFQARNVETSETVGLILLDPSLLTTAQARNRFEEEISSLQRLRHPTILQIEGVEDAPPLTWLTHEWIEGPTLLNEIRGGGPFQPDRAVSVIADLGGGLDAFATAKLACPAVTLANIRLTREGDELKIDPLTADSISATSAKIALADATLRRLRARGVFTHRPSAEFAYALAGIAYEILSGVRPGGPDHPYVPIPGLTKRANTVLRNGLDPKNEFESASDFADSLIGELTEAPPMEQSGPIVPAISRRTIWIAASAGALLLLVILFALLMPGADEEPDFNASPTPSAATPVPTPTPPTTDLVMESIVESGDQAAVGDYAAAFAALEGVDSNDSRVTEATSALADRLREDERLSDPEDFASLENHLTAASEEGAVSATYLLARFHDQLGEASIAFPLYEQAANAGDAEAMTKVGAAHAAGWGTPQSWPLAIEWFKRGAAAGDETAYYALGECYALGKGVERNPAKAFEYLDLAARAYDQTLAKVLLGDLYLNGEFGEPNRAEAFRLFTDASDDGSLDAEAKIGVMVYQGLVVDGAPVVGKPKLSDDRFKQAFEIWTPGAEQGNPLALYYHAALLESGYGTQKDLDQAREEYILAARGGNKAAIKWCEKNDVDYAEPAATPEPENPTLEGEAPAEPIDPEIAVEDAAILEEIPSPVATPTPVDANADADDQFGYQPEETAPE